MIQARKEAVVPFPCATPNLLSLLLTPGFNPVDRKRTNRPNRFNGLFFAPREACLATA